MLTNLQLVDFAVAAKEMGAKYWYGTCWYPASASLFLSKRRQYPTHYTASREAKYKQHISQRRMVCDCVGLIKGFFWSNAGARDSKYGTNGCPDTNADGMIKKCKTQGPISTLPEVPGVVLWSKGHIGVYIGNGYAIEARGLNYGVVKTKVAGRGWKKWGRLPMLQYVDTDEGAPASTDKPMIRKGAIGAAVREMQRLLLDAGQKLPKYGVDGDFGSETERAVKAFQKARKIEIDGVCGPITWGELQSGA